MLRSDQQLQVLLKICVRALVSHARARRVFDLIQRQFLYHLGAKPVTFPCFIAVIILGSVILTPLFSLVYVIRGFGICCSHYFKNLDNIMKNHD